MDLSGRLFGSAAAQLGNPAGLPGRVLGHLLNQGNGSATAAAVDALDIPDDGVMADLGFGGGVGIDHLLRRLGDTGKVHGVDRSTTMLNAAARRFRRELVTGRLALHQAPIEHLPLETSTLDGAITLNTLYFITDLKGALAECARVLKPSGQLVIGIGDPDIMARQRVTSYGFRVRPLAEVTQALLAAGLEVDQHQRLGAGKSLFHLLVAQPL
jgi:arsenite methyltransferase